MIDIQLNKAKGLESLSDTDVFPGNEKPCNNTPPLDPRYVHRKETARWLLGWLAADTTDGLWCYGDRGCGKSSGVRQLLAYLNRPLFTFPAHEEATFEDLLGTKEIVNGDTFTYDGALPLAAKHGAVLLIEEWDRFQSSVSVALNSILDGHPIPTLDGGVTITPKPGFRILATANTAGNGDMTGEYNTANVQDKSVPDRFWLVEQFYPDEETELLILKESLGDLFDDDVLKTSIRLANDIRYLRRGDRSKTSKKASEVKEASIDTTFSTRALKRFWNILGTFDGLDGALDQALEVALTNGVSAVSKETIHQLAHAHFGDINLQGE